MAAREDSEADTLARASPYISPDPAAAPDESTAPSPPTSPPELPDSGPETVPDTQFGARSTPAQEPPEHQVAGINAAFHPSVSSEEDHPMNGVIHHQEDDPVRKASQQEDLPMNGLSHPGERGEQTADGISIQPLTQLTALPSASIPTATSPPHGNAPGASTDEQGNKGSRPTAPSASPGRDYSMVVNGHASPTELHQANADSLDSEDEILIFRPSVKRRRTTTTRPQPEGVTSRFVADFILDSSSGKSELTLHDLIASLKDQFAPGGVPPAERVRLLEILGSGRLQGQTLQYNPPEGKGINLSGKITTDGKIACSCSDCNGSLVSLLEFEEHSGAWKRYQTQCVYLPNQAISLKDLWLALNAEFGHIVSQNGTVHKPPRKIRHCRVCKKASKGLMKCGGGCKQYVHAKCVGLVDKKSGPWSCLSCMEEHIQKEVAKAEEARQKAWLKAQARAEAALQKAEQRRSSLKASETPKNAKLKGSAKAQSAHRTTNGSKPQRVHMAAPTAKAGLTKGRMVRNSNKHKRLFDPDEPNGVKSGQHVVYKTTQGEILLEGEIRVTRDGPCGILCEHCDAVISCSAFEAHAGRGSRRAPYDNIFLNGIALRKLAQALPAEEVVYYPSAETSETAVQEDMMGGCVLCEEKNFQREGFSNLTVILCDGCEREYHIKCLQEHRSINLECLPEGDWFCSPKCKEIHHALRERVALGLVDLNEDYQWQLLHGKDGTTSTTWQLKGCQDILEESFDPIIDQISKQNLVKGMVYSEQQGEWDHSGMFAAVLKYKKQNVCALVMRAFGDMLAEVPLIATKTNARRRGHARYLMDALSSLLSEVGVKVLSLPAAHATVGTWTGGFGFQPMAADSLLETRESLRLLVFPGTEVLYKPLRPEGDPYMPPRKPKHIQAAAEEQQQTEGGPAPLSGDLQAQQAHQDPTAQIPRADPPASSQIPIIDTATMDVSQAAQAQAPAAPSGGEPTELAGKHAAAGEGPAEIAGSPVVEDDLKPGVVSLITDVSNFLRLPSSNEHPASSPGNATPRPATPPAPLQSAATPPAPLQSAAAPSTLLQAAAAPSDCIVPSEQAAEEAPLDRSTEAEGEQSADQMRPVSNGLQRDAAAKGQDEIPGLGQDEPAAKSSRGDSPVVEAAIPSENDLDKLSAALPGKSMEAMPPHQPVVS